MRLIDKENPDIAGVFTLGRMAGNDLGACGQVPVRDTNRHR